METKTDLNRALSIGVLGGTGVAGTAVVQELRRRGHDVRVMSRRTEGPGRIDLADPASYPAALDGLEVLIDVVNHESPRASAVRVVLVTQLRAVLAAAAQAGVGHVVSLSILGAADVPMGYYRVKVEQEEVVRASALPSSIVRATQFHGLVASWAAGASKLHPMVLPRGVLQPVDPAMSRWSWPTRPRRGRTAVSGRSRGPRSSRSRSWGAGGSRRRGHARAAS